jgi:hypothetical protein
LRKTGASLGSLIVISESLAFCECAMINHWR